MRHPLIFCGAQQEKGDKRCDIRYEKDMITDLCIFIKTARMMLDRFL